MYHVDRRERASTSAIGHYVPGVPRERTSICSQGTGIAQVSTQHSGCSLIGVLQKHRGNNGTTGPVDFVSYGSYVGALDRDRLTPYYDDKVPAGSCNGPNLCFTRK